MVSAAWTQGMNKEEKDAFLSILSLEEKSKVYERLLSIVQSRRRALETSEIIGTAYDNPNWAYKQAHNNGARQMLQFIETLLDFKG